MSVNERSRQVRSPSCASPSTMSCLSKQLMKRFNATREISGVGCMIFCGKTKLTMKRNSILESSGQYLYWVWPVVFSTIVFTPLSGCTVYQPVPAYVPAPSTFDRAWSAAVGAAQDEGVRITSEDRARGV